LGSEREKVRELGKAKPQSYKFRTPDIVIKGGFLFLENDMFIKRERKVKLLCGRPN